MGNDNILFQNEDVCILNPMSKKGILIFTKSPSKNICSEGLYSYNKLIDVHPELQLKHRAYNNDHDDLIFFRAPYNYNVTSFKSSYDLDPVEFINDREIKNGSLSIIRIDPEKTYVYSSLARDYYSEERDYYHDDKNIIKNTRIPFNEYLRILKQNSYIIKQKGKYDKPVTDILSYEKKLFPINTQLTLPWIDYFPIERNSEVVVKLPHIPPNWIVECYSINDGVIVSTMNNETESNLSGGNYKCIKNVLAFGE